MADLKYLPHPTHDDWEWQTHGACRAADTSYFFHPELERGDARRRRVAAARQVCSSCPVLDLCRRHALTVGEAYGTWGGLDEVERRALLKQARRAARTITSS